MNEWLTNGKDIQWNAILFKIMLQVDNYLSYIANKYNQVTKQYLQYNLILKILIEINR